MTDSLQGRLNAVTTPQGGGDIMAFVLRRRRLMLAIARGAQGLTKMRGKPIKLGKICIVQHHALIVEALRRDTDFLASPSYAKEMEAASFPFVLGTDRGPKLSVESSALYAGLAKVDMPALSRAASLDADQLLSLLGTEFDAIQDLIWPVCGATAQRMFGLAEVDPALFRQASRSVFAHIFLDAAKKAAVRDRAVAGGALLSTWLCDEIARRRALGEAFYGDDYMAHLLRIATLDDDAVRRTLGGMLVGSIDTINGVAARVLLVAEKTPKLRKRMIESLGKSAILGGYCLEAHRLWAQTPMIVRVASRDTEIGGTAIKKGQKLLLLTHSAMFDESAFNKAMTLRPDRPAASYLHYGAGVHACAGRALADLQIPMLVGKLLARGCRVTGKMRWAGPFPDRLPVRLEDAT